MFETLKLSGIDFSSDQVKFNKGPEGRTALIDKKSFVVLFRPLNGALWSANKNLHTSEGELQRRREALDLYNQILPRLTLPNELAIVQGEENGVRMPVICRATPKVNCARNLTELRALEIIRNPRMSNALLEFNLKGLGMLVTKGIILDSGGQSRFGRSWAGPLSAVTRRLITGNLIVGRDQNGLEAIFCDPDWFDRVQEQKGSITLETIKKLGMQTVKVGFWGLVAMAHKLNANSR